MDSYPFVPSLRKFTIADRECGFSNRLKTIGTDMYVNRLFCRRRFPPNRQKIDLSGKMLAVREKWEAHPSISTGNQVHSHTTVVEYR
jgi:hypothetical protein